MPVIPKFDFPDTNDVYEAVGRALSRWEALEWTLTDIFVTLIETQWLGAERAIGAISSSAARMEALTAAAEAHFIFCNTGDLEKTFRELKKQTHEFAAQRNRIAHGMVSLHRDGPWLGPAWYSTKHNKMRPISEAYRYSAEDINGFAEGISRLRLDWLDWRQSFQFAQKPAFD